MDAYAVNPSVDTETQDGRDNLVRSSVKLSERTAIRCIDNKNLLGEGAYCWKEVNGEWYIYEGYKGPQEYIDYVGNQGILHAESFLCQDNFTGAEMLGRIGGTSVTVNLVPCRNNLTAYVEYGKQSGTYTHQTESVDSVMGEPLEIVIDNLEPHTRYFYRVLVRRDDAIFLPRQEGNFTTRREQGEPFVFAVTSDIHYYQIRTQEEHKDVLRRTLLTIKEENPDFHIDLGDSFCTDYAIVKDSLHDIKSQKHGYERYQELRTFLDGMHRSLPFFFVLGNHEGELGFNFNDLARWSENARLLFIPNPQASTYPEEGGARENYYAFTWGDALFVMLDPYSYTTVEPTGYGNSVDDWTLGTEQLHWLRRTLENSDAQYTFMFIHHLAGGCVSYGRGGGRCADRGEWGVVIHPLLVEHNVDIVFHGHDHAFADETKDGIRYTLVPVPHSGETEWAMENYYSRFTLRHNPGHLSVTVDPVDDCVAVQYIQSAVKNNGKVVHCYSTGSACRDTCGQCPIEQLLGNHSEETELLRCLRDEILSKTPEGQEIIKLYYQWSPALVRAMVGDESFKKEVTDIRDWLVPIIGETLQ